MFCIVKDHKFHGSIWEIIVAGELINFDHLVLKSIEDFDAKTLLKNDLHLLFIDAEEGICGKATLSSIRTNKSCIALGIHDVAFHLRDDSDIHEDIERFEQLAEQFYQELFKTAFWINHKLSLKHIVTTSKHKNDHEDLTFFGKVKFSSEQETSKDVVGVISNDPTNLEQFYKGESLTHKIKAEASFILYKKEKL
ncbi:hypothetical protein IM40_08165 [Candidatus Paracaedimonas acanthamoebae]|nr:hypothetical protein IM40_08165 [Candidatus Paracaedimonas acanthamoebae]